MKDIILLHGAIGAADQLQPLASALSTRGYRPHCFAFSGHGSEDFGPAFGIDQWVDELAAFIRDKGWTAVPVFGYSMGGYVALRLAQGQPGLLSQIATLATKFAWSPETAKKEAAMLAPEGIKQKVPHFAAALQARHGDRWEGLLQHTAEMMQALGAAPLLDEEGLRQLDIPVLLGLGDKDTMVSLEETRAVLAALPQGQMYMLPATKHPIETAPLALLASLLDHFFTQ